jgi:hypothetical protein
LRHDIKIPAIAIEIGQYLTANAANSMANPIAQQASNKTNGNARMTAKESRSAGHDNAFAILDVKDMRIRPLTFGSNTPENGHL